MANHTILSTEETIAVLNKTTLPTLIIEGIDDVVVYRKLEEIFADVGVSVMGVGGRTNLLKIFERVDEIKSKDQIVFIADRDLWVLSKLPPEYISERLIFTNGYSIENDVFQDCSVEKVMDEAEKKRFIADVQKFAHWYALIVSRINLGVMDGCLKTFPGVILDGDFAGHTALMDDELFPDELKKFVIADYSRYVRGKSLMQIVARQISRKGRNPRLNPDFFLGIASANPGPNLQHIFSKVGALFGSQTAL